MKKSLRTSFGLPICALQASAPSKEINLLPRTKRSVLLGLVFLFLIGGMGKGWGQTNNYFGTTGTINGNVWSTNPAGPYTSALNTTGGAIINFGNTTTTVTGASITVFGINATADVVSWTAGGTNRWMQRYHHVYIQLHGL
ncbi:MAG TPA: hypothetical protein VFV79_10500 [Saprospiraceae bacterium]|nr:hypothetical protein [Saprospiraceae bacterium]